ncbi:MAG: hypothetical protein OXN21_02190 [Chloroflexota bacterium]|nr:hypothetical protein [Chloroflexota bacterium]
MAQSLSLKLALVLVILALTAAGIFVAVSTSARAEVPEAPDIPTWPSFTMLYEADGPIYSVGDSDPVSTREVRQLVYTSPTQWTDTVIEATAVQTPVGTESTVGNTSNLKDTSYTESDASGETTYTETVEADTTILVSGVPAPFPIEDSRITTSPTTTEAKVCFFDECTENAPGLLYRKASGTEAVYVDDARGIPLRMEDSFVVREIRINAARQQLSQ